jgi:hypothetical protein
MPKKKGDKKGKKKGKSKSKSKDKELFCSPDRDDSDGTCYTRDDLVFLSQAYNRSRPHDKHINVSDKSKMEIWKSLQERLKSECSKEWCWLEQNFVPAPYAKVMMNETFRPKMPREWKRNPYQWLTTPEISRVMKQYEKKYTSFLFIGPQPVDCPSKITCALSNLNVSLLINKLGKTKLGVIYNLDPHDKPGSHWVAMFADFLEPNVIYFDSVGIGPPNLIRRFMEKLKKSIEEYWLKEKKQKKNVPILVNRTRFQFGSSECGIFSMYFIIDQLGGNTLKELKDKKPTDKKMNQLRKKFYRPD